MKLTFDQQITFLGVTDLERTAFFYQEMLGLTLALDQGSCRIYRTSPGAFIGFCRHLETSGEPKGIILTLVSTKVDEWYHYLLEKDVSIPEPPVYNPKFNIYHFFFRDPDGYLVEIQQFFDSAWPTP